jgi:serine/threonine protein kinase
LVEALAEIHGAGYMHRDFKPENVMIDENLRVKVVSDGVL